jgi:uncharacterized protein DUF6632
MLFSSPFHFCLSMLPNYLLWSGLGHVNDTLRMRWLRLCLRALAVGFLAAFVPWITLILLGAPILAPGGALAPLLRFQPYNAPYEVMIAAVHIVWAVMLWRAASRPEQHALFIDFTIWANAAHGLVMVIVTPLHKGPAMTVIESIPLLVIAAILWWLRPRAAPGDYPEGDRYGRIHTRFHGQRAGSEGLVSSWGEVREGTARR